MLNPSWECNHHLLLLSQLLLIAVSLWIAKCTERGKRTERGLLLCGIPRLYLLQMNTSNSLYYWDPWIKKHCVVVGADCGVPNLNSECPTTPVTSSSVREHLSYTSPSETHVLDLDCKFLHFAGTFIPVCAVGQVMLTVVFSDLCNSRVKSLKPWGSPNGKKWEVYLGGAFQPLKIKGFTISWFNYAFHSAVAKIMG